ncbi:unnamed protein product [Ectocarpus fasciculatus]
MDVVVRPTTHSQCTRPSTRSYLSCNVTAENTSRKDTNMCNGDVCCRFWQSGRKTYGNPRHQVFLVVAMPRRHDPHPIQHHRPCKLNYNCLPSSNGIALAINKC